MVCQNDFHYSGPISQPAIAFDHFHSYKTSTSRLTLQSKQVRDPVGHLAASYALFPPLSLVDTPYKVKASFMIPQPVVSEIAAGMVNDAAQSIPNHYDSSILNVIGEPEY
jgi:hypothetical protein